MCGIVLYGTAIYLESIVYEKDPTRCTWWRHHMETFSTLLALCAGNSTITGEFPSQRPVTRNFDVFFDVRLNKRCRNQSWGWWFETPSRSLWRHCNDMCICIIPQCVSQWYHVVRRWGVRAGRMWRQWEWGSLLGSVRWCSEVLTPHLLVWSLGGLPIRRRWEKLQ